MDGIRVQGVYDDRASDRREDLLDAGCPFLGKTSELVGACRDGRVDIVYVALPLRAEVRIMRAMEELADTTATVYLVADFLRYHQMAPQFTALGRMNLISLHDTPFHGISGLAKRLEDVVIGSMILLGISLPLLLIALLVKASSRGPVLFRQRRYGLNGAEIRVLKFRTMTVCEDGPTIAQAQKNDPRVTPLGRFPAADLARRAAAILSGGHRGNVHRRATASTQWRTTNLIGGSSPATCFATK